MENNLKSGDKKAAFTLAEVLITLAIIGVVAALTLPALIQHHQKQAAAASLKKMYSTLLQAAQSYQADNEVYITDFNTSLSSKEFMEEYFNPYLKILKTCNNTDECWNGNVPKELNGTTNIKIEYGVILNNGSILGINSTRSGKVFFFDVNGTKGYNRSGRDIFNFYLINTATMKEYTACVNVMKDLKSGIYPGGFASCYVPFTNYTREQLLSDTSIHRICNKNAQTITSTNGNACAVVIMLDGWEISKDYPW